MLFARTRREGRARAARRAERHEDEEPSTFAASLASLLASLPFIGSDWIRETKLGSTWLLSLALGHRWPWDQVGGARVGRGTVALRCLGCLPTITSNISGVKDAQRSRRQSIWAVYTSLRHTAKYTGFGCISYVYSPLASSRLACHAIQRIQRIQRIQPYSHTRHTSYSAIQPPSAALRG